MIGVMIGRLVLVTAAALLVVAAPSSAARPAGATATPQTITVKVHAPASAAFDTAFSVAASSSSELPVAFSSGGSCTNSGETFTMTSGGGTCQVKYDQPGNATYDPAPQVVELVAARKASQRIDFPPLPPKVFGARDIAVLALATSDLPVSLAASGSCTISGVVLHLTGPGSCTVAATQPGNANYEAAAPVSRTFAITRPACKVPKVGGKKLAAAKSAIVNGHCRTGKVRNAASRKGKGVVIAQSRRAGLVLAGGTRIDLVVSRGRA